jgi:hypothetical protein
MDMEWSSVHDPNNEFDFPMDWTLVGSMYNPEEIQEMIDNDGVQAMVKTVNQHFKMTAHGHPVMQLAWVNHKKP